MGTFYVDLADKKFNRLTVIMFVGYKNGNRLWKCQCDCGNIKNILEHNLKSGNTKSCGCLNIQRKFERTYKHGNSNSNFYNSWKGLKIRCNRIKNIGYKNYGGRGITYDPRWNDFLNFKEDMYFKYLYATKQLKVKRPSIERIDVNGNYCFDNCCFIERGDQNKNRRNNRLFKATSLKGEEVTSKNQREFARHYGLFNGNISSCLQNKMKQYKGWKFKYI